jgi:hypothetical protein
MRAFARRDPTDSMPAALRVTGLGHEDAFPRPRLSARCWFSQGTFARTWGNGRDAPIPVIPATATKFPGSTRSRGSPPMGHRHP